MVIMALRGSVCYAHFIAVELRCRESKKLAKDWAGRKRYGWDLNTCSLPEAVAGGAGEDHAQSGPGAPGSVGASVSVPLF